MIRVAVDDLEPGMVLATPLPHPNQPRIALLKADYRLEPDTIEQLRKFNFRFVWIQHPGFDFLDSQIGSTIPEPRAGLYHGIKTSFTGIAHRSAGAFNLQEYRTTISNMILALVANGQNSVWAERIMEDPEELFSHSANVAYLALVVGMSLREYIWTERRYTSIADAADLTNLGIGAMLHDLAKLTMPPEIRHCHGFEKPVDLDLYRQHPERGFNALRGRIDPTAAAVVLHHHQRFDGEGFPKLIRKDNERISDGIKGHRIHIFSRIVAAVNTLDGLMNAAHRRGKPTIAALASMQSPAFSGAFDPVVLDAALRCIPPFALGTCVTLSDGRRAVVVDLRPVTPCQPKVQVINAGATPEDPAGEELDLAEPGAPVITAEGPRSVREYLYALPEVAAADDAPQPQPVQPTR